MTRYSDFPDHPLRDVPQEVLDVARGVLAGAVEDGDVLQSIANPLADAVVMALHDAHHIKWPAPTLTMRQTARMVLLYVGVPIALAYLIFFAFFFLFKAVL